MRRRLGWLTALWLWPGVTLVAQGQPLPEASPDLALLSSSPALSDTWVVTPSAGVSLDAGTEDGQARFRLAGGTGRRTWSLTLASPIDEGADFTSLASLDGLADGINLGVAWSWMKPPAAFRDPSQEIDAEFERICSGTGLSESCNTAQLIAAGKLAAAHRYERLLFGKGAFQTASIEARVGRQRGEFFDATGEASSETNLGWSLEGSYGLIFPSSFAYATARFERDFADQRNVRRCSSTGLPEGFERCDELPFGAPSEIESVIVTVGWRSFVGSIALDPRVRRNFETEVTAVEIPIYLVTDGDQKLTGGLQFGWVSKVADNQDELSAAVFIAAPLKIGF